MSLRNSLFLLMGAIFLVHGCSSSVGGPNRAPVAVAGADQVVQPGDTVQLDASRSYDPDGDTLGYEWKVLSRPGGSSAVVVPPDAREASFAADQPGMYVVGLVVSDSKVMSERDVIQVRALGTPCVTDADCPPDDGEYCNGREVCQAGQCAFQVPDCDDGEVCTLDACNEQTDTCDNTWIPIPDAEGLDVAGTCDDGTDNDCDSNVDLDDPDCVSCAVDGECDDGNACTTDVCDTGTGRCVNNPVGDGTGCDDGLFCTDNDTCVAGMCTGSARDCSSAGDQCNQGTCDEVAGLCVASPVTDGTGCDDGRWCTEADVCTSGACNGADRDCSAESAECVAGVCNESLQRCEGQPMTDGSFCDDGFFCTENERCTAGICGGGGARDCSAAGGGCLDGVCNEQTGACEGDPLVAGTVCDDTLFCTVNDQCDGSGNCQGAGRDCTALDSQCSLGTCDEAGQACVASPINEGNPCDDGLFCNQNEVCVSGACAGGAANLCDDTQSCTIDTCDEANDLCVNLLDPIPGAEGLGVGNTCIDGVDNDCDGAIDIADSQCQQCQNDIDCDDGIVCTVDTCVANICQNVNQPQGTFCDDGLFCTVGETCDNNGACLGSPMDCTGLDDECNLGACNDTSDQCEPQFINQGGLCDDGIYCMVDSTCTDGVCGGGNARDCSGDTDQCNLGVCNEGGGQCEPQPANQGNPCDDGVFCNDGETCQAGVCQGGGPRDCSVASDQCNLGTCDEPTTNCVPVPQPGQACQDGLFCTDGDTCNAGGTCDPGAGSPCLTECQTECDNFGAGSCNSNNPGTACGVPAASQCDNPDTCDGLGTCQDNNLPPTAGCGDQGVECLVDDTCDGLGGCTDNGFEFPGVACGDPSDSACDAADTCDGGGGCLPNLAGSGAPCGDQGVDCRVDDTCDGLGFCDDNGLAGPGAACGDLTDTECNPSDSCDAGGVCQSNLAAGGDPCGDQGLDCLVDDTCDGVGGCTDNGFEASGTACGDPTDTECDLADSCDAGGVCQANPTAGGDPCGDQGVPCLVDDTCDGAGGCTDNGPESNGVPCDDFDVCTEGDACDGGGSCIPGPNPKDTDGDTFTDEACGGNDCDDLDPQVNPSMSEGPVCDASGTCYDGKDNECDGDTDGSDGDCQSANYICLYGPGGDVPVGGPGDTVTVYLDNPGYDPAEIICYTDNTRLIPPETLLANDFETDMSGFTGSHATRVARDPSAQSPFSAGGNGVAFCRTNTLTSDPIDTTGRSRIQVQWAGHNTAEMDNDEYVMVEYSPDDGSTWYVLQVLGDNFRENWQVYTHILPPRAEGVTNLRLRWREAPGGNDDECGLVDDVVVSDLPDPTVSWTVLANDFEVASGNSAADDCDPGTLVEFTQWGNNVNEVCLWTAAQNPASLGSQGLRIVDDDPNWALDPDVDTTYVPAGSDLISEFYMQENNMPNNGFAGAYYNYGGTWFRLGSVGATTTIDYDWFRFVWDQAGIGVANAQVEFRYPAVASGSNSQGIYADDYELNWYRASYDVVGVFSDGGDGSYTANIQSTQPGTATLTCIFYGGAPPLTTDGSGDNSSPESVVFVP